MFTGIVEKTLNIVKITEEGNNKTFTISCPFAKDLYIDQSIAHNGVCLTVTGIDEDTYTVTAIEETLQKTNLDSLTAGDLINFERAAMTGSRVDGHFVQGHVDKVVRCLEKKDANGSWIFYFAINQEDIPLLVNKGSVCINGVSLTIVEANEKYFSVAIIPYTYEHTTFFRLAPGDEVNIEFDILGKYIVRYLQNLPGLSRFY